jgi:CAAX protease family protein
MDMETETAPGGSSRLLNAVFFNDRGLRAGWRLLIYIAILFAFRFLTFTLLSAFLGKNGQLTITELTPGFTIVGDGVFFLFLLLAALIMSRIERRKLRDYGLPLKGEAILRRFLSGYIFWGFLPLTLCLLTIGLLHGFSFGSLALHGRETLVYGAEWAVAFILVGLAEEYALRGYVLYTLADGIGFWPAAIILSVLFGIGHTGNPGETRVGLVATVVFALFASVTLRLTGNLWLAVGAHAGWDWGQSFFYGVRDSGMVARGHLLEPSFHGPVWLTGGTVGPEGSAVTLVLWSWMIVIFAILYRRRGPTVVVVDETKN